MSFVIADGEEGAGQLRARPDGENVIPCPTADADGAPLADAADWCQWLPNNCVLADEDGNAVEAVPSSYFHRDGEPAARFYSYETCQRTARRAPAS
eukprot:SAG22_NODE_380_length_11402_cov_8.514154_11_plen_96_part_00